MPGRGIPLALCRAIMAKPDDSKAKKTDGRKSGGGELGIVQILRSHSESASLLRVLSNAGVISEESSPTADAGLFYNLEVMFSNIIHNGKNYLGPIKGYASLIQDDNGEENNSRRWADKIIRSVEQMEKYFELLSMFRVKGALGVTLVSWHELISNVLKYYSHLNRRGVPLEITNNARRRIRQRGELLRRVLVHLICNAYESIQGPGKVSLSISDSDAAPRQDGEKKVVIEISDTGCGIDEEKVDMIWKPFYTTKHDHVGLGLPFVAMAAPILNMDIKLHSMHGRGTTVTLVLAEQGG